MVKFMEKLPDSWRTSDVSPVDASRILLKKLGPDSAILIGGRRAWVVKFTNPADKFSRALDGRLSETDPFRRELTILGVGDTREQRTAIEQALWQVQRGFQIIEADDLARAGELFSNASVAARGSHVERRAI